MINMSKMSLRRSMSTPLSSQVHVVDGKMMIKVQYEKRKKYIKLQTPDFEEFISEVKCPDWYRTNQ